MAEKAQVGNPDFDWSAIGKKQENYSNDEKAKFDELYGKSLNTITDLQIIEGRVVAKNNREVVVNIGYKSDGVVALSEFRYNPDLKIGDTIEVFVEQAEDASGQLIKLRFLVI
ncbi:MAG TPA: S1 RNA-binding domain-containing protein [Bacteroidia bacterium]|nr:S1 RNA-binding domain-containing protein [Bacteroidia bacterium]